MMEKGLTTTAPTKVFQQNICRTCLRKITERDAVCIFSDEEFYKSQPLYQLFKEITPTLMEQSDALPKNICQRCAKRAKQAVTFKRSIEKANMTLICTLRKAEFYYDTAVANKLPSEFSLILDHYCSEMSEIAEEEETSQNSSRPKPSNINSCTAPSKSVNISKVRQWQTRIDNIIEGRLGGTISGNRYFKPNIASHILRANNNNIKAEKVYKPKTVLSGKQFVEDLLGKQEVVKPTDKSKMNTKISDTIVIIDDEVDEESIVKSEETDSRMSTEKKANMLHVEHGIDKTQCSPEEKTALVEKECGELLLTNLFDTSYEEPVACPKCDKRFTNTSILQRHLLYHSLDLIPAEGEKIGSSSHSATSTLPRQTRSRCLITTACEFCQEKIPEGHMRRHVYIVHKEDIKKRRLLRLTCAICKSIFKNPLKLQKHKMAVHIGRFKCDHCDKRFLRESLLNQHLQTAHGIRMTSLCYMCGKTFVTASMPSHLRTHTMIKNIKCSVKGCQTVLKYKSSLRIHLERVHGTEMTHMCEYCGKTFPVKASLMAHLRSHSKKAPYVCEICERGFKMPGELKSHFRNMHQREKAYKCPVCPQVFTYKISIKYHCGRFHPEHPLAQKRPDHLKRNYVTNPAIEKTFQCSLCRSKFAYEYNLKKHNRTFHPLFFYSQKQKLSTEPSVAK